MPSAIHSVPLEQIVMQKRFTVSISEVNAPTAAAAQSPDLPRGNHLRVTDGRTGRSYTFPIQHNAINAGLFKQVKSPDNKDFEADQNGSGLRLYDPGYGNTAVSESKITYMYVSYARWSYLTSRLTRDNTETATRA